MLTTRRRLAWVSSDLARSPRLTARISIRSSTPSRMVARLVGGVDLLGGDLSFFDELRQPPFVVDGEQVDLADLTQVHPHCIGRSAFRFRPPLLRSPLPTSAQQLLVGVVLDDHLAADADRRVVVVVVVVIQFVVDGDAGAGECLLHVGQHGLAQFDVAQHVADLVGVDLAAGTPSLDQRIPLGFVDAGHRRDERADRTVSRLGRFRRGALLFVDAANLATTLLPPEHDRYPIRRVSSDRGVQHGPPPATSGR